MTRSNVRALALSIATAGLLIVVLLVGAMAAQSAAAHDAPPLSLLPLAPTFQARLAPGQSVRVRGCRRPSDLHAYSARTGAAYRQGRAGSALTWAGRHGRRVATYRHHSNRFRALRAVVVAAWCE